MRSPTPSECAIEVEHIIAVSVQRDLDQSEIRGIEMVKSEAFGGPCDLQTTDDTTVLPRSHIASFLPLQDIVLHCHSRTVVCYYCPYPHT
jgi:hypothetical protein